MESRSLPVPDGLDGTRVDAALARMLGFSRTFAAEIADAGGVSLGYSTLGVFAVVVGTTMLILTALAHQSVRSHRGPGQNPDPVQPQEKQ